MRRLLSILLLVVFGLPIATPLFALAQGEDLSVPACCRRNGKHHCSGMVGMKVSADGDHHLFHAPVERCPMYGAYNVSIHHEIAAPPASQAIFAAIVSHPAGTAQVESRRRIARDRSRQKRGPPSISLL